MNVAASMQKFKVEAENWVLQRKNNFEEVFIVTNHLGDIASVTRKKLLLIERNFSNLIKPKDCSTAVVFLAAQASKISLLIWIWESIAEKTKLEKLVDKIRGLMLGLLKSYIGKPRQGELSKASLRS